MKKSQKRKGAITVEAAIVFPIFIMVNVFILSMLNLFYFHLVMQQALTNVGRTLAQYGYVVDQTVGLENFGLSEETKSKESALTTGIDKVITGAGDLVNILNGGFATSDISQIINNITEMGQKGATLKTDIESLATTLKSVNKSDVVNYLLVSAMNGVDDVFVKWMIGDYLEEAQAMTGSISEINYSVFLDRDSKDMILIAEYKYSLPFDFFDDVYLQQTMRIHPWVGGKTPGAFKK